MAKIPNCGRFTIKEAKRTASFENLVKNYFRSQLMNEIGKAMSETIEKMNPFEIKYRSYGSNIWESTNRYFNDEVEAIKAALEFSEIWSGRQVGVFSGIFIVKIHNGEPTKIHPGHEMSVMAALDSENQSKLGTVLEDYHEGYSGHILVTSKDVSLLEIGKRIKFGLQKESYTIIEILSHSNFPGILLDRPLDKTIANRFEVNSCGSYSPPIQRIELPEHIHVKSGEELSISFTISHCPDCKDGFYYPFVGPKEPCRTCNGNT